jgi:hypothetical protein
LRERLWNPRRRRRSFASHRRAVRPRQVVPSATACISTHARSCSSLAASQEPLSRAWRYPRAVLSPDPAAVLRRPSRSHLSPFYGRLFEEPSCPNPENATQSQATRWQSRWQSGWYGSCLSFPLSVPSGKGWPLRGRPQLLTPWGWGRFRIHALAAEARRAR